MALVRNVMGLEYSWDLRLILDARKPMPLQLGGDGQLGWTSWLGQRKTTADADEIVIRPNAAELRLNQQAGDSAWRSRAEEG